MTLKTNEVLEIEDGATVGITDGPNDWSLWLSMSRHGPLMVTFFTDQGFHIPPYGDTTNFFACFITQMELVSASRFTKKWIIHGMVFKGKIKTPFKFLMTYDTALRNGEVTFHDA